MTKLKDISSKNKEKEDILKIINVSPSKSSHSPSQGKLFNIRNLVCPKVLEARRASRYAMRAKGLSNVTHLTATLNIRMRQNGEGQAFIYESTDEKIPNVPNPKGRKKGEIVQSGLTPRGRRTIRVISDCYQQLVTNENGFYDQNEELSNLYNAYNRFITLTFRNIIPDDKTAKKLLDSFFKRIARLKGRKFHHLWVAERQKRGAIHFHILTPEKIVEDQDLSSAEIRLQENAWINRAWNEVVCNWAYKDGRISEVERDQWRSEYDLSESYYKSLSRFRMGGIKSKPKAPAKSKFLLLPNCIHVNSAGNYMAKYISKEEQNIVGGMFGASTLSRKFMVPKTVVQKNFEIVPLGNEVIRYMYHRAKKEKIFVGFNQLEHNESCMIWCKQGWKLVEWYYEFCALKREKEVILATFHKKIESGYYTQKDKILIT